MKLAVLSVLTAIVIATAAAGTAEAVACKSAGVPKGCVSAAGAAGTHHPAARPGRGVGGVGGAGAPGGGAGVNRAGVGR